MGTVLAAASRLIPWGRRPPASCVRLTRTAHCPHPLGSAGGTLLSTTQGRDTELSNVPRSPDPHPQKWSHTPQFEEGGFLKPTSTLKRIHRVWRMPRREWARGRQSWAAQLRLGAPTHWPRSLARMPWQQGQSVTLDDNQLERVLCPGKPEAAVTSPPCGSVSRRSVHRDTHRHLIPLHATPPVSWRGPGLEN